jgi:hypothetical protein
LVINIVEELIESNKKNLNKNINFLTKDIVNFYIDEEYDLVLIRDLFIHINNSDIIKILKNLKNMNIKYVALNNYSIRLNKDVIIGQHRKVNLLIGLYNLPQPLFSFNDYENDKF